MKINNYIICMCIAIISSCATVKSNYYNSGSWIKNDFGGEIIFDKNSIILRTNNVFGARPVIDFNNKIEGNFEFSFHWKTFNLNGRPKEQYINIANIGVKQDNHVYEMLRCIEKNEDVIRIAKLSEGEYKSDRNSDLEGDFKIIKKDGEISFYYKIKNKWYCSKTMKINSELCTPYIRVYSFQTIHSFYTEFSNIEIKM